MTWLKFSVLDSSASLLSLCCSSCATSLQTGIPPGWRCAKPLQPQVYGLRRKDGQTQSSPVPQTAILKLLQLFKLLAFKDSLQASLYQVRGRVTLSRDQIWPLSWTHQRNTFFLRKKEKNLFSSHLLRFTEWFVPFFCSQITHFLYKNIQVKYNVVVTAF